MKEKIYETIIIGGGISGLSCAKRLNDKKRDFLLISKDLGGRLLSEECCAVNYGGAYMTSDYVNMLKYVKKKEVLRVHDFFFFDGKRFRNVFVLKNIKHIPKMIHFLLILKKLRKHFIGYRKQASKISISEYFVKDPILMKYWNMSAEDFITENGFEELDKLYGNPVTAATAFIESKKVNAFYYMGMFFPSILDSWIVDLTDTVEKISSGYKDKILIDTVLKVQKNSDGLLNVKTLNSSYISENIVFAAPQESLSEVYDLPKPHIQQYAYVFNISGIRKEIFKNKKAVVFRPEDHSIFMIWSLADCSDIIYSSNPNPDLSEYYESHKIVNKIHWEPGMIIPGSELIKQKFEENVYIASDYNLSLMEDCFLTGLYAANQIISKNK